MSLVGYVLWLWIFLGIFYTNYFASVEGFWVVFFLVVKWHTVKPVFSKHLRESNKWLLKTGACLIQVNLYFISKESEIVAF